MRESVIVSTARTPIGVAFKGALNNIKYPTMMVSDILLSVQILFTLSQTFWWQPAPNLPRRHVLHFSTSCFKLFWLGRELRRGSNEISPK